MPGKQNLSNGLNDTPQLKPIGNKSGRGMKWKKYLQSNAVKAGMAGAVVLLLVLIIAWQLIFGGSSGTKSIGTTALSDPSQAGGAPLPPPASPDQIPADQNGQTGQESNQDQTAGTQPDGNQPEQAQTGEVKSGTAEETPPGGENPSGQPQIPEDVSKWDKTDFARARQANNPKLLEAVAYLGEKSPGSVPLANQLTDLLKTPKQPDSSASYSPVATYASVPGLIEAVINALAKNGSQPARQTLKQILSGKFITDNDQTAVDAVLKTLIQMPSAENDDLLFRAITLPGDVRPDVVNQQATSQPIDLRRQALDLVKLNASDNLRIKLAENLAQKGLEPNDPIADFLLQDDPANLSAQLVIYPSEDLPIDTKTKLEQFFQNYGSQAISLTMGIPTGTEGATPPPSSLDRTPLGPGMPADALRERISDYQRGAHLAKLLWGEPLASLMAERLGEVRSSLEKLAPEIMLSSTLPLDSIHAAMFKMFKKRAVVESPQVLESAGWTDKVVNDPGLLVVMKMFMLNRSKAMKTAPIGGTGATTPMRAGPRGYVPQRSPGMDAGSTISEAAQKKAQIEAEWMMTLSKMVEKWCIRMEGAYQAQRKAERRGQKVMEPRPTRLDEFEMPKDAKITAAYQLNWPDKAPADLGKIKPAMLKIQYFRLQISESMLKKTMSNFKRLAKGGDIHDISNGQWLEMIKNGSPNTKRSLDILVTSADKQPLDLTLPKEEPIELDVDILAVEITDPGAVKE